MGFRILADSVLVLHFAFILFVAFGGLLVLRWRLLMSLHLPAVVWGVLVECVNWTCPLNPLEDWFRHLGGEANSAYTKGFIDYYLSLIIQPDNLTRSFQITVGLAALAANLLIYAYIYFRLRRAGAERQRTASDMPPDNSFHRTL